MPTLEAHFRWTLGPNASTGGSTLVWDTFGLTRELTFYLESLGNSTATVKIETARNSTAAFQAMGSTSGYDISTAAVKVVQVTGPLAVVRPYLVARTDTASQVIVEAWGN